jgi:hypothetical protein
VSPIILNEYTGNSNLRIFSPNPRRASPAALEACAGTALGPFAAATWPDYALGGSDSIGSTGPAGALNATNR